MCRIFLCVIGVVITFGAAARADDADTLTIDGTRYRLDGIDAPESDQSCLDANGELYPCGRTAIDALERFVAGRPVRCADRGADSKHPDRRIGRCSVDRVDIQRWLVRQGWAINFEPYAQGRFKEDEAAARSDRIGMWRGCFVAPRNFRRWNTHAAAPLGSSCPPDAVARLFPDDPAMPPGCEIKGKLAVRAWPFAGIYHEPGCGGYRRTARVDRWFCTVEAAREAGFRRSLTCWF
jgi:endonuclease YncB( thermonuclease family)